MIQCSKCGVSNEDFHTVCHNCGYHLGSGDRYGAYSNTTHTGNNTNVYSTPLKTNGFAITSLVTGYFFYSFNMLLLVLSVEFLP